MPRLADNVWAPHPEPIYPRGTVFSNGNKQAILIINCFESTILLQKDFAVYDLDGHALEAEVSMYFIKKVKSGDAQIIMGQDERDEIFIEDYEKMQWLDFGIFGETWRDR